MDTTKKQTFFLLTICLLANKVQRLPSLVCSKLGKDGWLFFLFLGLVDFVFVWLALWFNKLANGKTTYEVCENVIGKPLSKILTFAFAVYFFVSGLIPFEAVHDIFANVLFDNLSWWIYAFILIIAVWFLAIKGIKDIGRLSELYFYLIIVSFVILIVMGASNSNLDRILPFVNINFSSILKESYIYNVWFGDFLLIFFFVGRMKEDDGKLSWPIGVSYLVCTLLLTFAYIVFYGLYENLGGMQDNMINSISQFSLLELDVGRIDWFLMSFFEIGTIISSALYFCMSCYCIKEILECKGNASIITVIMAIVYAVDIFLFKSTEKGAGILANITSAFGFVMSVIIPIILLIIALIFNYKNKRADINKKQKTKLVQKSLKRSDDYAKNN